MWDLIKSAALCGLYSGLNYHPLHKHLRSFIILLQTSLGNMHRCWRTGCMSLISWSKKLEKRTNRAGLVCKINAQGHTETQFLCGNHSGWFLNLLLVVHTSLDANMQLKISKNCDAVLSYWISASFGDPHMKGILHTTHSAWNYPSTALSSLLWFPPLTLTGWDRLNEMHWNMRFAEERASLSQCISVKNEGRSNVFM